MNDIPIYERGSSGGTEARELQMRRDNDTIVTPKVSLYDIDYAVYYHLSTTLIIKIVQNTNSIVVPVMFSSPEKWNQIQKNGVIRDNQKKLLSPLIIIRRLDYADDTRLPIVQTNLYTPSVKIFPYRTMNMQNDRVAGQVATKPSYEWYSLAAPNYVRVNYDIIVWTDYIEQMNDVIQEIFATQDHIWGDYWKFRCHINSVSSENVNTVGEDRLIKSTISLQVDGYLMAETSYKESNLIKQYSVKRVQFLQEGEESVLFDSLGEIPTDNSRLSDEPRQDIETNFRRNIRYRKD